jgi:hypothetical protein
MHRMGQNGVSVAEWSLAFTVSVFVTVVFTQWTSIPNLARIGQEIRKVRIEGRARAGPVS